MKRERIDTQFYVPINLALFLDLNNYLVSAILSKITQLQIDFEVKIS